MNRKLIQYLESTYKTVHNQYGLKTKINCDNARLHATSLILCLDTSQNPLGISLQKL